MPRTDDDRRMVAASQSEFSGPAADDYITLQYGNLPMRLKVLGNLKPTEEAIGPQFVGIGEQSLTSFHEDTQPKLNEIVAQADAERLQDSREARRVRRAVQVLEQLDVREPLHTPVGMLKSTNAFRGMRMMDIQARPHAGEEESASSASISSLKSGLQDHRSSGLVPPSPLRLVHDSNAGPVLGHGRSAGDWDQYVNIPSPTRLSMAGRSRMDLVDSQTSQELDAARRQSAMPPVIAMTHMATGARVDLRNPKVQAHLARKETAAKATARQAQLAALRGLPTNFGSTPAAPSSGAGLQQLSADLCAPPASKHAAVQTDLYRSIKHAGRLPIRLPAQATASLARLVEAPGFPKLWSAAERSSSPAGSSSCASPAAAAAACRTSPAGTLGTLPAAAGGRRPSGPAQRMLGSSNLGDTGGSGCFRARSANMVDASVSSLAGKGSHTLPQRSAQAGQLYGPGTDAPRTAFGTSVGVASNAARSSTAHAITVPQQLAPHRTFPLSGLRAEAAATAGDELTVPRAVRGQVASMPANVKQALSDIERGVGSSNQVWTVLSHAREFAHQGAPSVSLEELAARGEIDLSNSVRGQAKPCSSVRQGLAAHTRALQRSGESTSEIVAHVRAAQAVRHFGWSHGKQSGELQNLDDVDAGGLGAAGAPDSLGTLLTSVYDGVVEVPEPIVSMSASVMSAASAAVRARPGTARERWNSFVLRGIQARPRVARYGTLRQDVEYVFPIVLHNTSPVAMGFRVAELLLDDQSQPHGTLRARHARRRIAAGLSVVLMLNLRSSEPGIVVGECVLECEALPTGNRRRHEAQSQRSQVARIALTAEVLSHHDFLRAGKASSGQRSLSSALGCASVRAASAAASPMKRSTSLDQETGVQGLDETWWQNLSVDSLALAEAVEEAPAWRTDTVPRPHASQIQAAAAERQGRSTMPHVQPASDLELGGAQQDAAALLEAEKQAASGAASQPSRKSSASGVSSATGALSKMSAKAKAAAGPAAVALEALGIDGDVPQGTEADDAASRALVLTERVVPHDPLAELPHTERLRAQRLENFRTLPRRNTLHPRTFVALVPSSEGAHPLHSHVAAVAEQDYFPRYVLPGGLANGGTHPAAVPIVPGWDCDA